MSENKGTSANGTEKITKQEFDEAFGALASFLFEQYKKKKQLEATELYENNSTVTEI